MQPATTLTIASVGSSMPGSATSSKRMSPGGVDGGCAHDRILARTGAPGRAGRSTRHGESGVISYLRYVVGMADDYKGRIGQPHPRRPQARAAHPAPAGRAARHQPERDQTGSRRATRTSPWRCSRASVPRLDSEIVAWVPARTHLRVDGPTTLSGSIDVKTSKNAGVALLCALAAQQGPYDAAQGGRASRRSTASSRCSTRSVSPPVAQRGQRPRDRPAGRAHPARRRSTRRPRGVPARSSCSSARSCTATTSSTCPTPAAATSASAPSERTMSALRPSAWRSRPPTAATHASVNRTIEPGRPIVAHTERGDSVTENAADGGPRSTPAPR